MIINLRQSIKRLLTRKSVELIVINDWFAYKSGDTGIHTLHGASVYELLRQVYPNGLPTNTVFYRDSLTATNIILDKTVEDVAYLYKQKGRIYAVTYPADPVTGFFIAAVVGIGVGVAVSLLMPKPELPGGSGSSQPPSPNNSLAQRSNRQRIGGRVADAYGENWMYPDLAAVTYSVYVDHDEVEFATMTPGIGKFEVTRARDDTTDFARIRGATAEFYDPGQDVRLDNPSIQFGNSMTAAERNYAYLVAKRYDAVNGQVLPPPDNYLTLGDIRFINSNVIEATSNNINFTSHFKAGQTINIEQADDLLSGNELTDSTGAVTYSLSGNYTIASVTATTIMLQNPSQINAAWQKLTDNIDFTKPREITLSSESQTLWSDYFYTSARDHTDVLYNIVAPNGLYLTTTDRWHALSIGFQVESQVVDNYGNPIEGTLYTKNEVIKARKFDMYPSPGHINTDNDIRRTAAVTYRVSNPYLKPGENLRVRYRRTTRRITHETWSAIQEIRIADLMGIRPLNKSDYDNDATMVITKQLGTAGALSFKDRKFNCLAFRYVRNWRDNDALILSKRIDDISYHIGTDPDVGALTIHDFDMAQISAEVDRATNYFGTDQCVQFCYTFDKNNMTAFEMIATVANAGFCRAYEFGNKIRFYFESATDVPVANFTSHNIQPNSYQPSESFGPRNEHDGVVAKWRDPDDAAEVNLHVPDDQSATNAEEIELVGVRNEIQAYIHARRRDQKNKYARKTIQFVGHDESNIVIEGNRIAVADQFRADIQQGEARLLEMVGSDIILTTSNTISIPDDASATIWVQTTAGYVDNIVITAGDKPNQVKLARMPTSPISTDPSAVVRATYQVSINNDHDKSAYIVSEKTPADYMSNQLTAINYDARYYEHDNQYIVNQLAWLSARPNRSI